MIVPERNWVTPAGSCSKGYCCTQNLSLQARSIWALTSTLLRWSVEETTLFSIQLLAGWERSGIHFLGMSQAQWANAT